MGALGVADRLADLAGAGAHRRQTGGARCRRRRADQATTRCGTMG